SRGILMNLVSQCYPFRQAPLPYPYNALEPYIDTRTMELHYTRHFKEYVDNLNATLADCPRLQCCSLEELLCRVDHIPCQLRTPVRRYAGGTFNHAMYFEGLTPGGSPFCGALARMVDCAFGSFEQFYAQFKEKAAGVFGSGYAWLAANRMGRLCVVTTANQDTPLPQGLVPLLNIDVWEHAYYLKHYNVRADYIDDWFRTADFGRASAIYEERFC
ncbi:MAG: superoxide dismutase, partial [Oscillospiraceae bacterium]|nr:superoxide dismutase [Oscillospiraceae bacterium]